MAARNVYVHGAESRSRYPPLSKHNRGHRAHSRPRREESNQPLVGLTEHVPQNTVLWNRVYVNVLYMKEARLERVLLTRKDEVI